MALKDELYYHCKAELCPEIDDDTLKTMVDQIKPLKKKGHKFYEIDLAGVDLRRIAFTWDPKVGRRVKVYRGSLNDIQIMTFHKYGAPSLFKPSVAEVMSCVKTFVPDWSRVRFFWLDSEGLDSTNVIGSHHYCRCVLFGDEQLDVIEVDDGN